jgi:cystathionine beta-lyase/cystathionine gamma-synthase
LQTLIVPSGLAAITLVDMSLLSAGDEVLLPENAYGPGKELARNELARWGIGHRFYDPADLPALAAMIGPATKLVWLEAAGSVTMEFPDLPALVAVVHEKGVTVALDNTWGAGIAFDPFDLRPRQQPALGVDISVQALTKYASGGADLLMGSVTTRDYALHLRLKFTHMRMGWGVGANDIEAVLRSLPSLGIRYAAQDRAARTLARWWQGRPRSPRCGTPHSQNRPAMRTGRHCAPRPPACSRSSSTSAFGRRRSTRSSIRSVSSRSATRGPARSASSSRTIWRRCVRAKDAAGRWSGSRSVWKASTT